MTALLWAFVKDNPLYPPPLSTVVVVHRMASLNFPDFTKVFTRGYIRGVRVRITLLINICHAAASCF
jgi:hypothetical protein